jgi:hypothetical protein
MKIVLSLAILQPSVTGNNGSIRDRRLRIGKPAGRDRPGADTQWLRMVARYLPFAGCRCRIDITSDNAGFTGMLRVQIVSICATKIRRESPKSRMPWCGLAAAMDPSARQGIRL